MADIARLAGEKRATVGNWKSRNPEEFPRERGRGPRGPLYDRTEVTAWLEATHRLKTRTPETAAMRNLVRSLDGVMAPEDVIVLLLALLAVKATAPDEWHRLNQAEVLPTLDELVHSALQSVLPLPL